MQQSLIEINRGSKLKLEEGNIEYNHGYMPLINVKADSTIELNYVIFKENVIKVKDCPSCILAHEQSKMDVANCNFLDHSNEEFPYSCSLIHTSGDLDISESYFHNNYSFEIDYNNIITINVNTFICNIITIKLRIE